MPPYFMSSIMSVKELFSEIDDRVRSLQEHSGIRCPAGCGSCCLSENVEATVVEMMPLADFLTLRGDAHRWLRRLDRTGDKGRCVLFRPVVAVSRPGHCRHYALRPVMCRLFGFAAVRDKNSRPVFAACRHQKSSFPETVAATSRSIASGLPSPHFDDWAVRISSINPGAENRRRPINQAFRLALERCGLAYRFDPSGSRGGPRSYPRAA